MSIFAFYLGWGCCGALGEMHRRAYYKQRRWTIDYPAADWFLAIMLGPIHWLGCWVAY